MEKNFLWNRSYLPFTTYSIIFSKIHFNLYSLFHRLSQYNSANYNKNFQSIIFENEFTFLGVEFRQISRSSFDLCPGVLSAECSVQDGNICCSCLEVFRCPRNDEEDAVERVDDRRKQASRNDGAFL